MGKDTWVPFPGHVTCAHVHDVCPLSVYAVGAAVLVVGNGAHQAECPGSTQWPTMSPPYLPRCPGQLLVGLQDLEEESLAQPEEDTGLRWWVRAAVWLRGHVAVLCQCQQRQALTAIAASGVLS